MYVCFTSGLFSFPQGQWFATIVSREAGIRSNLSCFRTNNKLKCTESWNICDEMVLLTLKDRGVACTPPPSDESGAVYSDVSYRMDPSNFYLG